MQITCGIEISMSGTSGKPTYQRYRLRKWKLYDKNSQREEGKCPKSLTKVVIIKVGNNWLRREKITFGDWVSKEGKSEKYVIGKSTKQLTKEGAISFLEAQHKSKKGRKICHWQKKQLWTKRGHNFQFWWMKWIGK